MRVWRRDNRILRDMKRFEWSSTSCDFIAIMVMLKLIAEGRTRSACGHIQSLLFCAHPKTFFIRPIDFCRYVQPYPIIYEETAGLR